MWFASEIGIESVMINIKDFRTMVLFAFVLLFYLDPDLLVSIVLPLLSRALWSCFLDTLLGDEVNVGVYEWSSILATQPTAEI